MVLDPRAKFTVEDRKAQFDLVTRLGGMLNHMSWAVDAIIGVRDAATTRAAKLPETDPLRAKLTAAGGVGRRDPLEDRGHQRRRHDHRRGAPARVSGREVMRRIIRRCERLRGTAHGFAGGARGGVLATSWRTWFTNSRL